MISRRTIAIALTVAALSVTRVGALQVQPAATTPAAKPAPTVALPPAVAAAFKRAYPNATIKNVWQT